MKSHRLLTFGFILLIVIAAGIGISRTNNFNSHDNNVASSTKTQTEGPKPPQFNKHQFSISDPASIWIVVDKKRPLTPLTYSPADLADVGNGQRMRAEASTALMAMFTGAKTAGYNLLAESGYRSYITQTSVYNNEVKAFGQVKADSESARPGYSEHQTGWAVDIASPGCLEDCFGKTAASAWVLANASKYGFILRYPGSKASITGYRNEPWHFRYVGKELAAEDNKTGQTLEEFFGLPAAPSY